MNLNEFAQDVHENAIAHGWWDEPRSDGTLRALMHAELSEALEEYRAGRPLVWHKCPHGGMCETLQVTKGAPTCDTCTPDMQKPEGIAVELIDFCIRAMDTMAAKGAKFYKPSDDVEVLVENSQRLLLTDDGGIVDLPDLVDQLHDSTSLARSSYWSCLSIVIGAALAWISAHGIDPAALMQEKHEYNKTRTYKHGGQVC